MATQRKRIQSGKKREYVVGKGKPPVEHQFKLGNVASVGHGRPRTLSELRELVQAIGSEPLTQDGLTRIEAKLRMLYSSKNATDTVTLLAYGYGKVKDDAEITVNVKQPFNADAARILFAPRPSGDNIPPGEDQGSSDGAEVGQDRSGRDSGA